MNVVGVVLFVSPILVTEALKLDVVSLDVGNLSNSTEHCNHFYTYVKVKKNYLSDTPFMLNANFFYSRGKESVT